jgi:hypothetical protein
LLSGCNFVDGRSGSFHDRVEPARTSFLSAIGGDLQNGATISPSGYMVRSTRFLNVYFVAGSVEESGSDTWCVWALGGGAVSGIPTSIVAAEESAAQVSDCGKGDSSGEWISSDNEVAELLRYAQAHG